MYYIIIGDGPQRGYLESLTKKYNLQQQVKFFGYVENVQDYYNIFDYTIVYWQYHHQNFPNIGTKSVESMACGVPILHFNPDSLCEGYVEGKSGYFIDSKENKKKLKKVLVHLISKNDNAGIGKEARLFAEKNFDIQKYYELIFLKMANYK